MSVLIVTSHPDDEVLGCGGLATALSAQGTRVHSLLLAGGADARAGRPEDDALRQDIEAAHRLLGIDGFTLGDFPNIRMNTVPHLELVRFIEEAMIKTQADVVFTHHPADLNDDHRHTSIACQAAARLSQRGTSVPPLKALYFMEILSSTDWAFAGNGPAFQPDTFFELGDAHLDNKIASLAAYRGVMRPFPHPRCAEIIKGLAAYRGGQSGMRYAEAFQTAFRESTPADFRKG
jgi:LmbE family N-acetylglucosaminyl deacetylase